MTIEEMRARLKENCNCHPTCDGCNLLGYPHSKCGWDTNDGAVAEAYSIVFPNTETPHIKDSGERREFDTGAVRDIQEGKGRCDLMPLDVVSKWLCTHEKGDLVILSISTFVKIKDSVYLKVALDKFRAAVGWDQPTLLLEVAKHFEEGAKKYGEYNWQKGIPTHCYIDSAVRHYLKWLRGDTDEPHDRAFCWNILCCIWTCQNKPELNDYAQTKENTERCVSCGAEIPEGRQVCQNCDVEGGE